jgi:hypothetical protein
VLGITEQSFSQPYMLLSAELSPDEGYFKERLAAGRNHVVRAWRGARFSLPHARSRRIFSARWPWPRNYSSKTGAGKPISYRQGLRDFWQAYFKKAGANVRSYTMLREVPALP